MKIEHKVYIQSKITCSENDQDWIAKTYSSHTKKRSKTRFFVITPGIFKI